MEGYTLFTSDARPKYTKDILSVLALPEGAQYQFRYEQAYIPSDLQHEIASDPNKLKGLKILIAFKSTINNNPFIVPIRWATIRKIQRITDFYVFKFEVANHPLSPNLITVDHICQKSIDFLSHLNNVDSTLPVIKGYTDLVKPDDVKNIDAWIYISRQLALHDTFKNVHFLRVSGLYNIKKNLMKFSKDKYYICKEISFYNFTIDYYAVNYNEGNESTIHINLNSELSRLASGSNIIMDSRYDSFKNSFQTFEVPGNSFTEIQIHTKSSLENHPETFVNIPITIRRANTILLFRIITSTIGAALLAIPSLLPTASEGTKIMLIAIGALTLALGINLIYPRNRR